MMDLDHVGLLKRIDELYASVVIDPARWTDDMLAEWAGDATAGAAPSKPVARELRRCLRAAQKLRAFYAEERDRPSDHGDWRTRVDLAMGPRAWRPTLEIARAGLEEAPNEALFEEVKVRFRVVHSDRWMEGMTFAEWLAERRAVGRTQ